MCCGNRVVKARQEAQSAQWIVVYPDGRETAKASEVSAKLLAAQSPGATVVRR